MKKTRLLLILICLFTAGLTACVPIVSLDTTIDLQRGEKWTVEILAAFFASDVPFNQGTIEQTLDQTVAGLTAQGIQASWKRDDSRGASGSAVYVISAQGTGFESLSRTIFQQPGAISYHTQAGLNEIVVSLMPQNSVSGVQTVRYTIRGGKVISSNGTPFDQNTVYWLNPGGKMEAILQPPAGISWLAFVLIGVGVILIVVSIVGLCKALSGKSTQNLEAATTQPIQAHPGMAICQNCRHEIPEQAAFCPNCGISRF